MDHICRAVYRNADIYLLDDPLSSVDASVGRHIYENVILGLLKSKCLLLATHLTHHTQLASEVILIEKGTIVGRGTFEELSRVGHVSLTVDKVDDIIEETIVTDKLKSIHDETKGPTVEAERSGSGAVGIALFWKYFRAGNSITVVSIALTFGVLNQVIQSYSDLFLQIW